MKKNYGGALSLSAILFALLFIPGCNALNPLCGSSRPAPSLGSLTPSTVTMAEVNQEGGLVLNVNGNSFVESSVVIVKGVTLSTTIKSDKLLQVTITGDLITEPGTAGVKVYTPSGNSGNLGCSSGGTSGTVNLTITE